jgi:hypothetical protein
LILYSKGFKECKFPFWGIVAESGFWIEDQASLFFLTIMGLPLFRNSLAIQLVRLHTPGPTAAPTNGAPGVRARSLRCLARAAVGLANPIEPHPSRARIVDLNIVNEYESVGCD